MALRGICSYNPEIEKEFPWAQPDPKDVHSARCKVCTNKKPFSIATMGRTAFVSHAARKKHKEYALAVSTTPSARPRQLLQSFKQPTRRSRAQSHLLGVHCNWQIVTSPPQLQRSVLALP
ncbi:hypothetical protein FOCC_FOCC016926 [Frankliniella occidentalis]|nr:hypothetical protein FOCC_FOCC016926 [Frankliniella occidentalis]